MARIYPRTVWQDAATAESLTAAQVRDIRQAIGDDLPSILDWAQQPAQSGANEAAFRAAWPALGPLTDPQVRVAMRVVAELTGGEYVP